MDVDVAQPAQQWHAPAESSKSTSTRTKRASNSNRIKSKPASSAVLSSIIDSLDTLAPLPDIQPNDHFSETASRHSLPESLNRSVASSASIHKNTVSPGFGVEYGGQLELDDIDGVTDAALPPTVPTSRPPSGLSHYKPPKQDSKRTSVSNPFRPRPPSRKSSLGSTASASSSRNKLSSESWVRKSSSKAEDELKNQRGRGARKSKLRRVSSQDMLRTEESRAPSQVRSEEGVPLSLAEQIIAKAPAPRAAAKGRLFLSDVSPTSEDQPVTSPPLLTADSFGGRSMGSESKASSQQLSVSGSSLKSPSPIDDSIPTRTSSLRLSSTSPARKKKHKKSKKTAAPGNSKTTGYRPSSPIPESSWADLGEDDETVKRIRELREQRKSRLREEFVPSSTADLANATATPLKDPAPQDTPVSGLSAPPSSDTKRATRSKKTSKRYTTDPTKAHKTLGLHDDDRRSRHLDVTDFDGSRNALGQLDGNSRARYSLEARRPWSTHYRPTTAKSVDRPSSQRLSLDYSYAQAVNLFQPRDRDTSPSVERNVRESSAPPPAVRGVEFDTPTKHSSPSTTSQQKSKKSKRKPEDRWTAHHPDLPLAFEKRRNRRKSMSDARLTNAAEKELESSRRDSIEEAVSEYLQAPRLNRRVKNHINGRTIAYSEVGDPNGTAVFVCVGMGLTRYVTAFYDELASTLKLRLITIDRPGVGGSEPYPPSDKSGPLNWPEDVLTICQHLGIVKFSILAHSAGAIYALATALILPHLIRGKVHLLAPWVPPSQLEAISHPTASAPPANPLPRSQRLLRVLPTPFLKAANSSFMTAASASLKPANKRTIKANANKASPKRQQAVEEPAQEKPPSRERPEYNRRESLMLMDQYMPSTNPLDNFPIPVKEEEGDEERLKRGSLTLSATATPMDPSFAYASSGLYAAEHAEKERQVEYTSRLTQATWDMATKDSNPATDLLVCLERNRDVGFRYTDVGREVVITHGSEDKRVPIANVKWLAEQMNRRALGPGIEGGSARESRESWASTAKGGCEVRVLQGEGHGLMASPLIMGDILEEISKSAYGRESLRGVR
ncbi:Putative alpha/beta hydrolase-1 [Septoria linicola]|uniref:Alpha/beta hydrolase-1 n=1 Tax=Septoria linicola TaxID=215465 RepID=A0A9Q9AHM6_9PEZI|nr:putative alpha/beta hydrolase-1 [Septoria linicola]USW47063.1 Putative alpha/beta hydrolase-1 [Septoria linicola]